MKWHLPAAVAAVANVLVASAESVSPPVRTRLRSSWPAPDLLLEMMCVHSLCYSC